MARRLIPALLDGFGLRWRRKWRRDKWLWVTISLVPLGALAIVGAGFGRIDLWDEPATTWLSLVLWQPFLEELLFRGFLMGQLGQVAVLQRRFASVSGANVCTSIAFAVAHMLHGDLAAGAGAFAPSLLLGLFRERHTSAIPSMLLHVAFNAAFLATSAAWTSG